MLIIKRSTIVNKDLGTLFLFSFLLGILAAELFEQARDILVLLCVTQIMKGGINLTMSHHFTYLCQILTVVCSGSNIEADFVAAVIGATSLQYLRRRLLSVLCTAEETWIREVER